MFSQKKKKTKSLLFIIPVLAVFLAGLGLNAFMNEAPDEAADDDERTVSASAEGGSENSGNKIPVFEYNDNADNKSGVTDAGEQADNYGSFQRNSGYTESNEEEYDADESGSDSYDSENYADDEYDVGNDSLEGRYDITGYTGYMAVSEDGVMVIYSCENGRIVSEKRTDVQTDMLPEYDRQMLSEGIKISRNSELEELLQDYEG